MQAYKSLDGDKDFERKQNTKLNYLRNTQTNHICE
jgi:hypothetical protein